MCQTSSTNMSRELQDARKQLKNERMALQVLKSMFERTKAKLQKSEKEIMSSKALLDEARNKWIQETVSK